MPQELLSLDSTEPPHGVGVTSATFANGNTANKLVEYRLKQLEKKVELHNNAVERLYKAEGHIEELQHDVKEIKNRI